MYAHAFLPSAGRFNGHALHDVQPYRFASNGESNKWLGVQYILIKTII